MEAFNIIRRIISHLIAKLINISLNSGVFAQLLKTGCIVPIFKSDERNEEGNYRFFTVLTISNKTFERVVFIQRY